MGKRMEKSMAEKTEHLILGILAHVDAGKTTMAESMLYHSGTIKKPGRVDHKDAFLDTFEMERARGITIFSKQARINWKGRQYTLLDTPGHVDFSAEMERTLQVLDYAIMVISAPDGVQGHDITLWKLLRQYQIPVFIFVNKMDMPGMDRIKILTELQKYLDSGCIDFSDAVKRKEEIEEELAMCSEELMLEYLERQEIRQEAVKKAIRKREVFPCYFGSALKLLGVEKFLDGIHNMAELPVYPQQFGARVFKISRDAQGNRLTHMKITGGRLRVKQILESSSLEEKEKLDQIRLYSGAACQMTDEVQAGEVCAVTGLQKSLAGMGYGFETEAEAPVLEPVLSYQILLPEGSDVHGTFLKLCQLEEEEPQLHMVWDERTQEISAKVMGEVQIEVLKNLIRERFQMAVEFGAGSITYKETIAAPVEGVGHFEPLRHYAEVHLLLEPLERGSGLQFDTDCSEDLLDKNWQRLIMTHLEERKHPGVLTGSEITDMRITLIAGKAHLKHTEGGDFRQATYRAIRQGLKMAENLLLEPVYQFRLEIPMENVGRAMTDLNKMNGVFQSPELEGEIAVLTGSAPVACMRDYHKEVTAYSRGRGHLFCTLKGYEVCHNQEEVINQIGYDAEADLENPTGSVFCAHGAGFLVPWDQVYDYMHLEGGFCQKKESAEEEELPVRVTSAVYAASRGWGDDSELEEIFNRTYGGGSGERIGWRRKKTAENGARTVSASTVTIPQKDPEKEYLLVDGYNIIFAIPQLKELADLNIDSARDKLMDLLCNYQGYRKNTLILVYDAYKVEGGLGSVEKYHNIYVVYTKEAETADQYIEKTVHEIGKKYHVTVATSDALEQKIIWGAGADRMSAKGLWEEMQQVREEIKEQYLEKAGTGGQKLFHNLDEELAEYLEDIRLGRRVIEGDSGK